MAIILSFGQRLLVSSLALLLHGIHMEKLSPSSLSVSLSLSLSLSLSSLHGILLCLCVCVCARARMCVCLCVCAHVCLCLCACVILLHTGGSYWWQRSEKIKVLAQSRSWVSHWPKHRRPGSLSIFLQLCDCHSRSNGASWCSWEKGLISLQSVKKKTKGSVGQTAYFTCLL